MRPRASVKRKSVWVSESGEYEAEAITDVRIVNGRPEYLVKWVGYTVSESTWEPAENISKCTELLRIFERKRPPPLQRLVDSSTSASAPFADITTTAGAAAVDADVAAAASAAAPAAATAVVPAITDEAVRIQREANAFNFDKVCEYIKLQRVVLEVPASVDVALLSGELRRFLVLKALRQDCHVQHLAPSPLVEKAWHAFLLFPADYALFCSRLTPGRPVLDHNPLAQPGDEQRARYARSLQEYERVFGATPPALVWPPLVEVPISVFVKAADGLLTVAIAGVRRSTLLNTIANAYARQANLQLGVTRSVRLEFKSERLDPQRAVGWYAIQDRDQVIAHIEVSSKDASADAVQAQTQVPLSASPPPPPPSQAPLRPCQTQTSSQSSQPGVPVSLLIKNSLLQEVHFKILTTTKFHKVFDAYFQRVGKAPGSLKFLFDGKRVNSDDTPASIGLEDGDALDAYS